MLVEQSVVCPVMIGRDAPLSTVSHTLERARAAHGGTLLVSGEAGIGKSRLVREMVERARRLGFVTLEGASFDADRAQPYAPILDLVRTLASSSPGLAAHYFAPAADELVTLFRELRPVFRDATPRAAVDPEEDRRRLFHAVTDSVASIARVQPLLLVIEDVHGSDDATLDLLLHLARRIVAQPIALVLTFRSDEVGPRLARLLADLDRARCAAEVSLRPLAAAEVSAMLQAIFGGTAALGTGFVDRLHDLTEGNPFFVEEMLKALVVDGDLTRADGRWQARPLEQVRVPRTATEAVARRLAGLSEAARQVASVAAVAGRRFDFALLQWLTQHDERELLALVRELVDAQLVVEESADRFAFRHALTREAMRARLLVRERVALHRAIALALEAQSDASGRDLDDALAYHAFEAGMWDSARQHALGAAEHATALCAPHEALQQLERAVAATTQAALPLEPALFVARGRAHETLGAFDQADADFVRALEAARASGDHHAEWTALHALGMLWSARDYARAGAYRQAALDAARAIDEPALVARSLNRVGNWFVNGEAPRSGVPYHDEALAIFERLDDRRGVAETLDLLAMAHHVGGDQCAAVELFERAIALFTELDDRRGLANALSVLTVCGPSFHASSAAPCRSTHLPVILDERAARLASEIGWRAGESFTRWLLADALGWRGEYARALRLGRESLAIAEEIAHLQWQCGARRALGLSALDLGDARDAVAQIEAAYDIARRLGSAAWMRWTGAWLGVALARSGAVARATAVLDDVDGLVASRDRDTLGARQLVQARAEVALLRGAPAETLALLDTSSAPRAGLLRGEALLALGRWEDARSALDDTRLVALADDAAPLVWRIDAVRGAAYLGERRRLDARRAFDDARARAQALVADVDDPPLVARFLAEVDRLAPPPAARTARQAAKAAYGGLTRRERDTAALVALGKSNRAIARQLGIGERTVEGYVAAALAKLGATSRAQIAVWAAEQGLAAPTVGARRHESP